MKERVSLAPFTTFGVGGEARIFIEARTEEEIQEAITYARECNLQLYPLGAGSNLLVPDAGVDGVVLKIMLDDIAFENDGDDTLIIADAGARWEKIVDTASEHELFGIENLAGIPGTIGGASVQNIGAYGAELANTFEYADCINKTTGAHKRITRTEAAFAYRTSFFKTHREFIITRVTLRLSKHATPNITYPDLARVYEAGTPLRTPSEIIIAVRAIRAKKFPLSIEEGTAGSFFKNPVISRELADSLALRFPDLPLFPQEDGSVKISLAWLLDYALSLKGFSINKVRLYEKQPLIIVARTGATATEVSAFADEIAKRVFAATGIVIEREVETFGAK
ncbi:MAG: UDP-N-acetylmuramate dehydrogenase [Candidatus Kaiserbacteria bacterium]|nr:UDP-N-acetylmuramate dehydrogenase [Candidatus Kaiserbacteria bacterium]